MKIKILFIVIAFTSFCNAQIVNIPNANFKAKLIAANASNTTAKDLSGNYFKIDTNNDGEIQLTEALQVSSIDVFNSNITSIQGITSFSNLQFLNCAWNSILSIDLNGLTNLQTLWAWKCYTTTFNFSGCNNLNYIDCSQNMMTSLNASNLTNLATLKCIERYTTTPLNVNLTGCINLNYLEIRSAYLSNIDLTGLNNLQTLICAGNQLTSLNVSNLNNLTILDCRVNQISYLDVTNLVNLQELIFYNNNLTSINVNNLTQLTNFWGNNNQLTFLDLTNCINLQSLSCNNNQLTTLLMKNGINENYNYINNNPNLNYICCDDFEISEIQTIANPTCQVNSYCSFTPGGNYYTILGNSKVDYNLNGCDVLDYNYPNLKFRITNGSINTFSIPNQSGNYNFPVQSGNYTITPILENPTYYSISPSNSIVNFPTQSSPFNQSFCISPNGNHNDLEITILPINNAIAGFDATYKLLYKNKGNQIQSGSINLLFNDAVLDLISANPFIFNQTANSLIWNFTNLLPFESREIDIVINLNSPMETPPLNIGNVLNYTASINGLTDETPNDNSATLNQIVVNSYDPNDKTCLEGTTITPSMVGEYVHYLIRFENNGTANAQNIVVRDLIDTNKFDINTLIPIKGSHNFETRISSTNKVEFIFQNINLPFDNTNNDGYVSFKIKTKPNLAVGNTFSNSANIYFDYNFPIVTNNYTTTIQNSLGIQENNSINKISLYPNPVKDILKFNIEHNISKVEVYDVAGRILSSNTTSENRIDLSELKTGNYILKLYTEKGIMNTKIIKE